MPGAKSKVDTVGLKKRIAEDELKAKQSRGIEKIANAKADSARKKLGRSSIGESRNRDVANSAKGRATMREQSAYSRKDSLEQARKGKK